MRRDRPIITAALAVLLGGCAGAVLNPYYGGNFEPTEAFNTKVTVIGDPVGGAGKADVPQAILSAMQGHTAYPTDLALLPPGGVAPYRVIIVFDPPPGISPWALCAIPLPFLQSGPPTDAAPGRVAVTAALCRGDGILSGVYGYLDRLPADDPRFRDQIADVTRNLFPLVNPERQPRGRFGLPFRM